MMVTMLTTQVPDTAGDGDDVDDTGVKYSW